MSETNEKQIRFEFDRESVRPEYSNISNVFYSPNEFVIEFGFIDPVLAMAAVSKGADMIPVQTKSRIIIPIETMHGFVSNINSQYRTFLEAATAAKKESTHGKS